MRIKAPVAVAAATLLALLAGCGAPTPTPTPTATPSPSESPVATLAVPRPVLDLPCTDVVAPGVLSDMIDGSAGTSSDNGTDPVAEFPEIVDLQAGVLRCRWENGDAWASFGAMPHAADAYASRDGWYDVDTQYVGHDEIGDESRHYCGYGYCIAAVLVGDFWVSVTIGRPDLPDETDVEPLFLGFARDVAQRVRAAADDGVREPWVMPHDALRAPSRLFCEADDPIEEGLAQILGMPDLYTYGGDGPGGFVIETATRVGVLQCWFSSESDTSRFGDVTMISGGLWALPVLEGTASGGFGRYAFVSADVPGGQALIAANAKGASAIVPVDGSLVRFGFNDLTADQLVGMLPGVVELFRDNAG